MTLRRRGALKLGMDAAILGWQAQQVIAMRLLKIARGGPAAATESEKMVSEKMLAGVKIGQATTMAVLRGDTSNVARDALKVVQGPVAANRKRLSAELKKREL